MDAKRAFSALRSASGVITVSHRKPDGDTLGSATALANFCRSHGIRIVPFCVDPVPPQYWYMPGTEAFTTDASVFSDPSYDVVAVFDSGDLRYAGVDSLVAGMPTKPTIINFDHHATNEYFGDINVVDVNASSTAEVVFRFLSAQGVEPEKGIATSLLTGILTDTGSFSNAATTSEALDIASTLLRQGADLSEVSRHLVRNKPLAALKLWGDVLSRLRHNEDHGITSTVIFERDMRHEDIHEEHVEGVSNFLNMFLNTNVILVLRELPGGLVKGSFRTTGDTDVSLMARAMGGGGHKKAAGFTIPGRIVEDTNGWRVLPAMT